MGNETNAVLALKNAWTGAIAASDRLRDLSPTVSGLPESTDLNALDLDALNNATLAHANASQALRGLIEDLKRLRAKAG